MPEIYLDHASTTYTNPHVLEAMLPYFSEKYGNPEALHKKGKEALIALDTARETIAKILNCRYSEIYFTGSATEANNLAIFGVARANKNKGRHLITSAIEHSSVREPFKKLEQEGFEVDYLEVDKEGFISPEDLAKTIRTDTTFGSLMHANNEIGTIEPIAEFGEICHSHGVPFHTDAAQTAGSQNLDIERLKVDLMTINGSKIYGPKGVGALFVRKDTPIEAIIYGGGHEKGLRAGTHNIGGIVGLAKALELIQAEKENENVRLTELRDQLINGLLTRIPEASLNGPREKRLPNNVNILIPGVSAHELLLHLDEAGIFVSTGAACTIGTTKPSNTLRAIGLSREHLHSSIRMSLGQQTSEKDIEYVIATLPKIVEKMLG